MHLYYIDLDLGVCRGKMQFLYDDPFCRRIRAKADTTKNRKNRYEIIVLKNVFFGKKKNTTPTQESI